MVRTLVIFSSLFLLTSCVEEKWVGVIYQNGNDPLHIGTFKNLETCSDVVGDKAHALGKPYEGTCLLKCNYDYIVDQDVCEKAIDL